MPIRGGTKAESEFLRQAGQDRGRGELSLSGNKGSRAISYTTGDLMGRNAVQ